MSPESYYLLVTSCFRARVLELFENYTDCEALFISLYFDMFGENNFFFK